MLSKASKIKRSRKHGFRTTKRTGNLVIKSRRAKGRARITVSVHSKN